MRLWRSLGFPEVPADAVLFNDRDLDAAKLLASLTDAGLVDPDVREAVARATAQSMSRLAEWQVGMLERLMESSGAPSNPEQTLQVAREVLPVLEELQSYVWRRHLAAAVVRMLVPPAAEPGVPGGRRRGRDRLHPRDAAALHRRARRDDRAIRVEHHRGDRGRPRPHRQDDRRRGALRRPHRGRRRGDRAGPPGPGAHRARPAAAADRPGRRVGPRARRGRVRRGREHRRPPHRPRAARHRARRPGSGRGTGRRRPVRAAAPAAGRGARRPPPVPVGAGAG